MIRFIRNGSSEDSPQLWARLEDWVRLQHEVNDCIGGTISSGFVRTTIDYRAMPGSESELWVTDIKLHDTNLSMDELAQFTACAHAQIGRKQPLKEERYRENGFVTHMEFRWPLGDSDIFQFLSTGEWPGYNYGAD